MEESNSKDFQNSQNDLLIEDKFAERKRRIVSSSLKSSPDSQPTLMNNIKFSINNFKEDIGKRLTTTFQKPKLPKSNTNMQIYHAHSALNKKSFTGTKGNLNANNDENDTYDYLKKENKNEIESINKSLIQEIQTIESEYARTSVSDTETESEAKKNEFLVLKNNKRWNILSSYMAVMISLTLVIPFNILTLWLNYSVILVEKEIKEDLKIRK
ncbi:hypothetical protein BpHYR1_000910 [Brachionus plicatilis]|uniref:Uncharacterized protein n=1 Tax=Brachionus plicatilis TaxID=10195 RepID=A0A3M7T4V9_BRAPC|nr:hypothetical protein BpHYR1_000910 [Brachionus plicatilis]